MQAKSISGRSTADIRTALQQNIADGYKPTLAFVFISIKQERHAICALLQQYDIDVIGATSAGEFIDGHQSDGGSAILLLDIDKKNYRIAFNDTSHTAVTTAARDVISRATSTFSNPAFLLCSTALSAGGEMFEGEKLVHSIRDLAGENALIFGGMAGDDGTMTGTYIFDQQHSTDQGFVVLILDNDKIALYGTAISGWKPVGKIRTVTAAEDAWIYTIDEQPALDMYLRYLGQTLHPGEEKPIISVIDEIGMYYPFLAINAGEPTLRTPMEVDKDKDAIKLDFAIGKDKQLQFTLPPDFDIVETVLENADTLKKKEAATADALLVFSCMGRLAALGPMVEEENEGLHKIWGAPMAGFFSYGEFGANDNSDHLFHSTTCSWVALKEK